MTKEIPRSVDLSLLGDEHVRLYRETHGERGYLWNGAPILLLTTKGRRSGTPRTVPLIFTPWGASWSVIASRGGAPQHPAWYLNLVADPLVRVQVKADVYDGVARTAGPEEREQIWADAVKRWPNYDAYQARTTRQIPVVVIDVARAP